MTLKPDKPRNEIRIDRLSVFRRNVVDGNFEELKTKAENDPVENMGDYASSEDDIEYLRFIYNFLSSFVAWKKKAKKLSKEDEIKINKEDIESRLNQEIEEGKRYFLEELRNFLNHKGEINLGRTISVDDSESRIILGIDDELARDLSQRANAGGRIEKAYNYFKENRNTLDLINDLSDLHQAIEETDNWIHQEVIDD